MDRGASRRRRRSCARKPQKFAPDVVYVDTYRLFSDADGELLARHPRRERRGRSARASPTACTSPSTAPQYLAARCSRCSTRAGTSRSRPTRRSRSVGRSRDGSGENVPGYRARPTSAVPTATRRPVARTRRRRIRTVYTPPDARRPTTPVAPTPGHARPHRRRTTPPATDAAGHHAAAPTPPTTTPRPTVVPYRARHDVTSCRTPRRGGRRSRPSWSTPPRANLARSVDRRRQDLGRRSSTSTRSSRTTSRTRRPRSRRHASCATYGEHGEVESMLARAYVADAIADIVASPRRARHAVGRRPGDARAGARVRRPRTATRRSSSSSPTQCVKHGTGPTHLSDDFELVAETFRRFAEDKIRPVAEHVHRTNGDVPEDDHQRPRRDRRLRPLGARGVRRLRDRRRVRLHRHGRRDRGAVARLARHRRLARHPARDPHPRARRGRHRGTEAGVAAAHRERRAHGRDHGDRARLRLRRRGREGHRHADRRRLARQRREDVGDVRRSRRRADAARAHRPRPDARATAGCRCSSSRSRKPKGTRSRSTTAAAGRWKAARSTRSATAACTPTKSRSTTGSCPPTTSSAATAGLGRGLLPPDGRLRERPPADRGPRRRPHAGRVRSRARVRAGTQGVRQGACSTTSSRRRSSRAWRRSIQAGRQFSYDVARKMAAGEGHARSVDGEGVRVPGRRVGDPRGDAAPRRHGLRRGVPRLALLRRRPGALDLRRRRRDAVPARHRPPPHRERPRQSVDIIFRTEKFLAGYAGVLPLSARTLSHRRAVPGNLRWDHHRVQSEPTRRARRNARQVAGGITAIAAAPAAQVGRRTGPRRGTRTAAGRATATRTGNPAR